MPRAFAPSRVRVVYSLTSMGNRARVCALCDPDHKLEWTRRVYAAHILTPQHREAVAQLQEQRKKPRPPRRNDQAIRTRYSPATFCGVCKVECRTKASYAEHVAGRKHAAKVASKTRERRAQADSNATKIKNKNRGRVYCRRRKARGRWQPISPEAALWRQTRRVEQAVLQRWWRRHRYKRVPEFRERRETRRKRLLRRANARLGQARGWKEERRRKDVLAHARPEGKPGAAVAKPRRRDDREVHVCGACGVTYVKARAYHAHLLSAAHREAVRCVARPANLPSWCAVCRVHLSLPGWKAYDAHIAGKTHQKNEARMNAAAATSGPSNGGPPSQPQPPPTMPLARFLRAPTQPLVAADQSEETPDVQ